MAQPEDQDQQARTRRTFGRGYYEGAIAMAVNLGCDMNEAKLRAAEASLNGMARKVYNTLPTDRFLSAPEMVREMRERQISGNPELSVIQACLITIKKAGLAVEQHETYKRVALRELPKTALGAALDSALNPEAPVVVKSTDPMDRLATIAITLRDAAKELEDIAIGVVEKTEEARKEGAKLRQLKELLTSIKTDES